MTADRKDFLERPKEPQPEEGFWTRAKDKVFDGNNGPGIDLSSKIKKFAAKSVDIVAELDEELAAKNSSYEIGDFKVKASLTIVGGMSLDIHFVKTPTARVLADIRARVLPVTNPQTGKKFNVPRTALVGVEKAKVKDPHNGDILLVECKTGKVVGIKKKV